MPGMRDGNGRGPQVLPRVRQRIAGQGVSKKEEAGREKRGQKQEARRKRSEAGREKHGHFSERSMEHRSAVL